MARNSTQIWLVTLVLLVLGSFPLLAAEKSNLDLPSAIQMALDNNLELQIAKLNLAQAVIENDKSKAENLLTPSVYNELAAANSLLSTQNAYQNTKSQIVNDTIDQYSNLWLAALDLEIKAKKVDLENRLLVEAQAQYDIGDIGSVELLERENAVNDAIFSLETATDDYSQGIREFTTALGLAETDLTLTNLEYEAQWSVSEVEVLEQALGNSRDLLLAERKQELAQIDLDRAAISAAALDRARKELALEIAKRETAKTRAELTNQTLERYYQFGQTAKKIGLTEKAFGEAREKFAASEKQFAAGLITQTEVLEYELNMLQAEHTYLSAISGYYLTEQQLRQIMNLEPGVFSHETSNTK